MTTEGKNAPDSIEEYKDNVNSLLSYVNRVWETRPDARQPEEEDRSGPFNLSSSDIKERVSSFASTEKGKEILVGVGFLIILLMNIKFFIGFCLSFSSLNINTLGFSIWSFAIYTILPLLLWAYSTNTVYWNYFDRKFLTLRLVAVGISFQLIGATFFLAYKLFIPFVAMVKIGPDMTPDLIVGLGYIACFVPTFIITLYMWHLNKNLFTDDNKKDISEFKLKHYMENSDKEDPFEYTMKIIADMQTGKRVTVRQHDRYTHTASTGATGTAKTSSCILPAIADDLDVKGRHAEAQKAAAYTMIDAGKAYIIKPVLDEGFNINLVRPNPGHEKEFNDKVLKYKSAGLTVIGPDDSLSNEVAALCASRSIRCRLIDPVPDPDTGCMKTGFTGYNPLYISPNIPEWSRKKAIVKAATLFADVMQSIFEMSGKSDPYFSSINRIATTTICILLNVTYPILHNGKQPNPKHVQSLLNDFSRVQKYYECLVDLDKHDEYMVIRDVIRNSFLGLGRTKFEEHCNGLKVQLNNFLMDPNVEAVLCAEESIDLDQALLDGDVVVVNFALGELGNVNSSAFGLFFTMSYVDAVLRRPGNEFTRLPNFCYIDELPIIVSPSLESCFTLFRKYRVAMFVALQTFDQMEKSPFTKYLKGVLINSCSHHIVFGRANPSDMKLFSELAGLKENIIAQSSYTQSAVTVENPQFTESVRYTPELVNAVEQHEIRNRDFQEVTFFTVYAGRPLLPIHGKVFFLTAKQRKGSVKVRGWDWEKLYKEQVIITRSLAPEPVRVPLSAPKPAVSPRVTAEMESDPLAFIKITRPAPMEADPGIQSIIKTGASIDIFNDPPSAPHTSDVSVNQFETAFADKPIESDPTDQTEEPVSAPEPLKPFVMPFDELSFEPLSLEEERDVTEAEQDSKSNDSKTEPTESIVSIDFTDAFM